MTGAGNRLARAVGRAPTTVQRKLLGAFAGIVALLFVIVVLGLRALGDSNARVDTLGKLQQRVTAYRQLQTEASLLPQLFSLRLASSDVNANFVPTITAGGYQTTPSNLGLAAVDTALGSALDDLHSQIDVHTLGFAPLAPEHRVLSRIASEYGQLSSATAALIADDQAGKVTDAQQIQTNAAGPAAISLDASARELVRISQMEAASLIAQNQSAYTDSQHLFIGVAAGSILLALLLGLVLSWALLGPIKQMRVRLAAITSGDFSGHVDVPNRDELGTLAADLNRMNDQLGQLYTQLDETSRHKSEFLANMSHELRTPLNAVIGFSEVLQDRLFGELNDKQAEYVADIHSSGKHLLALINDILDLSKIEAGRMDLQLGSFSLAELMENSVALMRERATRQGIALRLDVDPGIGVIEADERKLKQVLFNLLSNAVKFTERGGHVEVSARAQADTVVVCVRDDGAGIAPDDQARIFEAFEQADAAHLQEGTGLGLALSRRFIELHGGRLEVESELGSGSAFTFTVSRSQPQRSAPVEAAAHASTEDASLAGAAPRP